MIDWYFILFIAFGLVIIYIEKIGEHQSINHYILFNREAGLSDGSYALTIQFITGGTVFLPIYLTDQFKLSSFFIILISALILYLMLKKVTANEELRRTLTLSDPSLLSNGKIYFIIIFAFSNLGVFFIQLSLLSILFGQIFQTSLGVGITLFLSFSFIFFGLGGSYGLRYIGSKLFFSLYIVTVLIGLTLYMRTGIEPIYYQFYSHFSVIFDNSLSHIILAIFTFIFMIFGQTTTNLYFWESIHSVKSNHRLSVLRLSMISWSALMLLYIALTIYMLAKYDPRGFFQILQAIHQVDSLILNLFTVISISAIMLGVGTSIYSLNSLFLYVFNMGKRKKSSISMIRRAYLFSLVISILIGIMAILFYHKMGYWLPFFIGFFSAAGVPFLFMKLEKKFQSRRYFYTMTFMTVISISACYLISDIWLISFLVVIGTGFIWFFLSATTIVRK